MNPATFARKSDMLDVDCLVVQARRAELRDVEEQAGCITMSGVAGAQEPNGVKGRFRVRDRADTGWPAGLGPGRPPEPNDLTVT